MANKPLPSPEVLRQLLRYEPETGKLFWKKRGPEWFSSSQYQKTWNSQYSHKEVGCRNKVDGYRFFSCRGVLIKTHRAIWAMVHDEWPFVAIDHINGIRTDNRIENLRSVTRQENQRNMQTPSHNSTGAMGVTWDKKNRKWRATIQVSRKSISIGRYRCITSAIIARKAAEVKYGFHENHGRAGRSVLT